MYRQYTHCVWPEDYVDNTPPVGFWAVLGDLWEAPKWVATACSYLLGGKLVCLGDGSDQCAIGHITHFEPPSDKSFPANIDNDFSLNILLAPHDIGAMTKGRYIDNYDSIVHDGHQGWLMQEQPNMPIPHESGVPADDSPPAPIPSIRYQGYATKEPDDKYPYYDPSKDPFQVAGSNGQPFWVPSFHLECEGSRAHDVCAAISAVQGPASAFCDIPIIGWITCFVVDLVTLPILATAVAIAWASAVDGDTADPRVGPGGKLELGNMIVATGRWVYDAGHQGWNEFHPVKRLQLIPPESATYTPDFDTWRQAWCEATANVPPYAPPGNQPTDMTPPQAATYDNQLDPANQWVFHPAVDGCQPTPNDNPDPPR